MFYWLTVVYCFSASACTYFYYYIVYNSVSSFMYHSGLCREILNTRRSAEEVRRNAVMVRTIKEEHS